MDTGCDVAPACLACPLPKCRYDMPGGIGAIRRQAFMLARAQEINAERMNPEEAAKRYGVSLRTVYRWLRFARERGSGRG